MVKATPRPLYPRERPGTHFFLVWAFLICVSYAKVGLDPNRPYVRPILVSAWRLWYFITADRSAPHMRLYNEVTCVVMEIPSTCVPSYFDPQYIE